MKPVITKSNLQEELIKLFLTLKITDKTVSIMTFNNALTWTDTDDILTVNSLKELLQP